MYRNTRFQELMEGLPRNQFQQLVDKLEADKYNKGFTRWNQLVSMIFAQVSGSKSLRILESRFNSQKPKASSLSLKHRLNKALHTG